MLLINSDLNVMEGYAIQFRYPGQSAEREEAKQAVKAAQAVRLFIRGRMGLA